MSAKAVFRKFVPKPLLEWNRKRKKRNRLRQLEQKKQSGDIWTEDALIESLQRAGVDPHKDLLVHSAMSKIGYLEQGPKTIVGALIRYMGADSTILMPTSPVSTLQANHKLDVFDVANTPSLMGAVTEYFRTHKATHRSGHPLEPVAAYGPNSSHYTMHHHADSTAYGSNSPWFKHMERGGQILYIGTTLINSGTSLHAVEDAIGHRRFKFPIYLSQPRSFSVAMNERRLTITTTVHNPEWSAKRQCDGLIPLLEQKGALRHVKVGEAPSLLVDAAQMKSILLEAYTNEGVTMYTPQGS